MCASIKLTVFQRYTEETIQSTYIPAVCTKFTCATPVTIICTTYYYYYYYYYCRCQWPRGLRSMCAVSRLPGSWVRIPPGAWMSVFCDFFVLSCRDLCDELITCPEESYLLWCVVVCDLETSRMRRPWPTGGCCAKIIIIIICCCCCIQHILQLKHSRALTISTAVNISILCFCDQLECSWLPSLAETWGWFCL